MLIPAFGDAGQNASDPIHDYGNIGTLRFAMLHAISGVNPTDAQVAVDLNWSRHLAAVFPGLDSQFEIYTELAPIKQLIHQKQLHGFSMGVVHFLRLREQVKIKPVFISSRLTQPLESYLLLARKGLTWERLSALSQRRLTTEKIVGLSIGRMWLETLLQDRGLPSEAAYFQTITPADKPARIILPVFFGQADVCLAPESAYETMIELNPQISHRMTILARSPGLIKTIHGVTDLMPDHMVQRFVDKGLRMKDTVDGNQLLLIFHVKQNFPFQPAYLNNSQAIYKKYHQYKDGK